MYVVEWGRTMTLGGYRPVTARLRLPRIERGSVPGRSAMEFQILGPVEVREGGRPIAVAGAKERAVLALLLLHANQFVSSDRIVDEIWGPEAAETARKSLQVRVAELRKALRAGAAAGELLQGRGLGYVLIVDAGQLDLHRFERLVEKGRRALGEDRVEAAAETLGEALALWRGPALADLAYEPFAQGAIARLEELRLAALELRIDADLARGRHAELVGELRELGAEHPLRERLRAQLMVALYRSGRQGDALEVYQEARRALVAELGLEPSPVLRSLEQAILRQDAVLDLAPRAGRPRHETPDRSILVVVDQDESDALLVLGEALAREPLREVILARVVRDEAALAEASDRLLAHRESLVARGVSTRAAAFTSSAPGEDLVRLAGEQDVDLLLARIDRSSLGADGFTADTATLLARSPCDVGLLVAGNGPAPQARPGGLVIAPFGGSEHDWAAFELAAWIARALEVPLRLLGRSGDGADQDASRILASASLAVQRALGVAAEPVLVSGTEEILAAAETAGLLVVGLSTRWRQEGVGAVRRELVLGARPPVILARRGLRPGGLAPRESLSRFTWSLGPTPA